MVEKKKRQRKLIYKFSYPNNFKLCKAHVFEIIPAIIGKTQAINVTTNMSICKLDYVQFQTPVSIIKLTFQK